MSAPSYVVLLKAFRNDAFLRRRLRALQARMRTGRLCLMLDETRGPKGKVDHTLVLRCREKDLVARGFANHPAGQLFWYNCDYSLYYAYEMLPPYDYYLMMEYDAVAQCDLDALVARAAAAGVDYVGQPLGKPVEEWAWLKSCRDAYPEPEPVHAHMICVTLFSRRAVAHLRARRLELSAAWHAGTIREWPISEAYMPTEMARGGFVMRTLSDYGRVPRLSWWPPYHEAQLRLFGDDAFVHPVLSGQPYLRSFFRNGLRAGLRAWWQMAVSREPPTPI